MGLSLNGHDMGPYIVVEIMSIRVPLKTSTRVGNSHLGQRPPDTGFASDRPLAPGRKQDATC